MIRGMLSRLTISPEENRGSRLDEIERAWGSFTEAIPNHPLVGVPTAFEARYPDAIHSVARAVPDTTRQPIEQGMIVIGEKFLDAERSVDERHLTLLHESIHLKLMCGAFAARTLRVLEILKRQQQSIVLDDNAGWMRFQLSAEYLKFPDEIWAELYLRNMHADWFDRRQAYYLAMREARDRTPLPTLPAALIGYWQGYEWLTVHLGRRLDANQKHAARWADLLADWEAKMQQAWGEEQASRQIKRLTDLVPPNFAEIKLAEGPFDQFYVEIAQVPLAAAPATDVQAATTTP